MTIPQDTCSLKSLLTHSLREKPGSYVIEELLQRFPTLSELVDATEEELLTIEGIGKNKAKQMISMLKLSQMFATPVPAINTIKTPMDVYRLLEPEFRHWKQEKFICIYLNTKNGIISKELISIGTLNATIVHPRDVFRSAIKRSCASIICAHNHPSGDTTPSSDDIALTKRLVEVGLLVGIEVLDHLVIGHNSYTSLKEQGLL